MSKQEVVQSILSRTWQRSILRQLPDCCAYFRYHFLSKLSKQLEVVLQFAHSNCCHGRWNGSEPFAWNNMATVRRKHSPLPPRCHGKFYSLPPSCFACGPYISPLVKSLTGNPLIAAIPFLGSPTDGVLHGVGRRDQHEDLQLVFLWFWQKGLGLASWPDQGRQVAIVLRPRGINLWRHKARTALFLVEEAPTYCALFQVHFLLSARKKNWRTAHWSKQTNERAKLGSFLVACLQAVRGKLSETFARVLQVCFPMCFTPSGLLLYTKKNN